MENIVKIFLLAYGAFSDGTTTYINASTCNLRYKPIQPPFIFDIALPEGVSKMDHK
jgi:hypothetical protein